MSLCRKSDFCVGVSGRRETWKFVFNGGDWNGFSFRRVREVVSVNVCGDGLRWER